MKKLLTAFAILLFSTAAWAAPSFAEADTNADGLVSMDEARAALPEMEEAQIVAADVNRDGALSQEEYTTLTAT